MLFKMDCTVFKMSPGGGAALPPRIFLGGHCGAFFTRFLVVTGLAAATVHNKYGARKVILLVLHMN